MASVWIKPNWFLGAKETRVEMNVGPDGMTLSDYMSAPGVYTGLTDEQARDVVDQFPSMVEYKPTYNEVAATMLPSSLWPMDDADINLADVIGPASATPVLGNVSHMTRQSPSIMPSGEGYSTYWDGTTNTFFTSGDYYNLAGARPYSFACWARYDDNQLGRYMAGRGTATTDRYYLGYVNSSNRNQTGRVDPVNQMANASLNPITPGVPFHHAVTFDGTNLSLYTNGTTVKTLSTPAVTISTWTSANPFRIGCPGYTTSACWLGCLQNMAIWDNVVLTADQIESLWRVG